MLCADPGPGQFGSSTSLVNREPPKSIPVPVGRRKLAPFPSFNSCAFAKPVNLRMRERGQRPADPTTVDTTYGRTADTRHAATQPVLQRRIAMITRRAAVVPCPQASQNSGTSGVGKRLAWACKRNTQLPCMVTASSAVAPRSLVRPCVGPQEI